MEEESQFFEEESELNSEYGDDPEMEDTLNQGRHASRKGKSKKQQQLDEKAIKKQRKQAAQGAACCGSGNKGCSIF